MGRIILISGPCGAGKSSLCQRLAQEADSEKTVHLHTDDFYQYICKGYIPPWQKEAGDQNETVIQAAAACAKAYAQDGYEVYVDGVVGPWFLGPWKALAARGQEVRYVVLRPSFSATAARAAARERRAEVPLKKEDVETMWRAFANLGEYEGHVLDTSAQTLAESARVIGAGLAKEGWLTL